MFGAQATGCSPVSVAYKAGADAIRPVKPDTIAKSLAIGNPADGIYVLDICRRTGGAVEDITDEEVREGILLLARNEGIFTETAGGTTVGVLKKLVETGQLDPTLETVVINTGMGLKTLDAVPTRWRPCHDRPVVRRLRPPASPGESAQFHRGAESAQVPSARAPRAFPEEHPAHERFRPDPHHPAHLHRRRVRGERRGRDLAEVLDDLDASYPGIKGGSSTRPGSLRRFVNVYVGNDDVRFLENLETATPDGTQISVIPAVAGG